MTQLFHDCIMTRRWGHTWHDLNVSDFALSLAPAPAGTSSRVGIAMMTQDAGRLPVGLHYDIDTKLNARQFNLCHPSCLLMTASWTF